MADVSEAKRAANRENAKKSTGPRTDEGKRRARVNALKHGMAAAVELPEELREEGERRVREWVATMKPREGAETWLVERAAMDAVRVDAAARATRARLVTRLQRDGIYTRSEEIPDVWAERTGNELFLAVVHDPSVRMRLRVKPVGCDWMIARWNDLMRRHKAQGVWEWREFSEAQRLLGYNFLADHMPIEVARFCIDFLLIRGSVDHYPAIKEALDRQRWKVEDFLKPGEKIGTYESASDANGSMIVLMRESIAELTERRDLLAEAEALEDSLAAERMLVDLSPEGKLLQRYETELLRRVHQTIDQLAKLQKSRDTADLVPEKPSRNEATDSPTVSIPLSFVHERPAIAAAGLGEDAVENPSRNEATDPAIRPAIAASSVSEGPARISSRNEATEVSRFPLPIRLPIAPGSVDDTSAIKMLCDHPTRNEPAASVADVIEEVASFSTWDVPQTPYQRLRDEFRMDAEILYNRTDSDILLDRPRPPRRPRQARR